MPFGALGLDETQLRSVEALGYEEPTPIQVEAIPHVLAGHDVVGCAQTGTGKTAAFVLPTIQRIRDSGEGTRALVVTPTRELAQQIVDVARDAARTAGLRVAAVYGGVKYGGQIEALRKGVDLLVATPGRLLDLQQRGEVKLDRVQVLVLDEADRMLDMGFWPDVRRILSHLPEKRQNLLFSATMSNDVLRVVRSTLTDPISVDVGPVAIPVEAVDQALYPVNAMQKAGLLAALISKRDWERVLVFTRTKARADRLSRTLERAGISAAVVHSDRAQAQRQKALDGFRSGKHRVMVATDVMARGIDVEDISHVINYDFPEQPEDYVHRIGRTARAGRDGMAISLVAPEEIHSLQSIEAHIGRVLRTEDLEGFDYKPRAVPNPDRKPVKSTRTVFSSGIMRRGRRRY